MMGVYFQTVNRIPKVDKTCNAVKFTAGEKSGDLQEDFLRPSSPVAMELRRIAFSAVIC
jgi:hypothetical protein